MTLRNGDFVMIDAVLRQVSFRTVSPKYAATIRLRIGDFVMMESPRQIGLLIGRLECERVACGGCERDISGRLGFERVAWGGEFHWQIGV